MCRGSFLCHARDDSAYFWGADKKSAGDQFWVETARRTNVGRTLSEPFRLVDVPFGRGSHFLTAGSHKTHCHGIAVEELPFFMRLADDGSDAKRSRCKRKRETPSPATR
jgi:hypothetical protein